MLEVLFVVYSICLLLTAITNMGISSALMLGAIFFVSILIEGWVHAYKDRKAKKYREKVKTKGKVTT